VESGGAAKALAKSLTGSGISHGRLCPHASLCRNAGAAASILSTSLRLVLNVIFLSKALLAGEYLYTYDLCQ
jgi:hypothetical protein